MGNCSEKEEEAAPSGPVGNPRLVCGTTFKSQPAPTRWKAFWHCAAGNGLRPDYRVLPPDSWRDRQCAPVPGRREECRNSSVRWDYSAPPDACETRNGISGPLLDRISERCARTTRRVAGSPDEPAPAFPP